MRRVQFIALALAVAAVAILVVASAQQPVVIRVVGFRVGPTEIGTPLDIAYQSFIANFEAAHPNIDVEALETPPDFDTQVLLDLAAGNAPEVWTSDNTTLARVAETRNTLDMRRCQELVPEFDFARFFPNLLQAHTQPDGAVLGVPNDFTPMVIYYNPTGFERAGVALPQPGWTWRQFLETARALTRDFDGDGVIDQYGFRVRRFSFEWQFWVWQNGSDFLSPDRTTATGYLDSRVTIGALQFLADMVLKEGISPTPSTLDNLLTAGGPLDLFLNNRFVMFPRGHWELVGLRSNPNYAPERVAIIENPRNVQAATVFFEAIFNIPANLPPDRLLAACQFVEAATDAEYQQSKIISGIAIPANEAVARAAAAESELERQFLEATVSMRPSYGASMPQWPAIEGILDTMMEKILAGTPVADAAQEAAQQIDFELGL